MRNYLFYHVRECITWGGLGARAFSPVGSERHYESRAWTAHIGEEVDGAAAASAAALARPCRASMGAPMVARGNVSSDSSSDDGAVLDTIPYVAYLCGCRPMSDVLFAEEPDAPVEQTREAGEIWQ